MKESGEPGKHSQKPASYRSYLLRLWCTGQREREWWRASVEDLHTGERIGFANLEELFAFLMEKTENKDRGNASSDISDSMSGSRSAADDRE